jgi:hypothetical protein
MKITQFVKCVFVVHRKMDFHNIEYAWNNMPLNIDFQFIILWLKETSGRMTIYLVNKGGLNTFTTHSQSTPYSN